MIPERKRLQALAPVLAARAKIVRAIREFFNVRGFLEVETPLRIAAPPPEVHIDAEPSGQAYLRTSPELHMKRLLAAGYSRIYQLGPCFRRGEFGARHHPEYSMLEWYRTDADYRDILLDAKALLQEVARQTLGKTSFPYQGRPVSLDIWECLTVSQAFIQSAGWDPAAEFDADRFDLDLVDRVEPSLPFDKPTILLDYPASAAALSRRKKDDPRVAERWELYIAGMELANAYTELTDAAEQIRRFDEWNRQREVLGKEKYPRDEAFLDALGEGMPPAGGIALGVDRLIMLLTDSASLDEVLPFRAQTD